MATSLALVLLVTLSGAIVTYLYDEDASLSARLCTGLCLGLTALSLIGFVVASLVGLTGAAIVISTAICCSPLALLTDSSVWQKLQRDFATASTWNRRLISRPESWSVIHAVCYFVVIVVLWQVFDRAVIEDVHGISTGLL